MRRDLIYLLFGYLSGSILYADVFSKLFHKEVVAVSKDQNPGTANAFLHGGFFCGILTLLGDTLKGCIPVALYLYSLPDAIPTSLSALVVCAPVAGHIFPASRHFRGGKGIATTFGCLLGLFPYRVPFVVLCGIFLFYSLVLRITPNLARTQATYLTLLPCLVSARVPLWLSFSATCMTMMVLVRLHHSCEVREKPKIRFLWRF